MTPIFYLLCGLTSAQPMVYEVFNRPQALMVEYSHGFDCKRVADANAELARIVVQETTRLAKREAGK